MRVVAAFVKEEEDEDEPPVAVVLNAPPLLESSIAVDSRKHLSLLKKPVALLNLSMTLHDTETSTNPYPYPYSSPPRSGLLRSMTAAPTPAVSPLLGTTRTYPSTRGRPLLPPPPPPKTMNRVHGAPPRRRLRLGSDDSILRPCSTRWLETDCESPVSGRSDGVEKELQLNEFKRINKNLL